MQKQKGTRLLCTHLQICFVLCCSSSLSVSDAIMEFSGGVLTAYGPNETASIFATYPSEYMTLGRSFLDQVSGRIHVNFSQYFNSCSFIELIIAAFMHFIRWWAPAC